MYITKGPIIIPTTGMDRSLDIIPGVAAFAGAHRRPLYVVHVLDRRYEDYSTRRVAEALANLNGLAPAEVIVVSPKERLPRLRTLAASEGGVVALLPQRRSFVGRLVRLITDYEQLMLEGPLPVLALPPSGELPAAVRRVLFPIDLASRSEPALDDVAAFCKQVGAELHLLHVFGPDRPQLSESDQAERDATGSPSELYQVSKRRMQALAERAGAQGARVVLNQAEGRAHAAILGYIHPHDVDLIAMATHGPRNGEDIWYGTTTARVIKDAKVPVIAIRS